MRLTHLKLAGFKSFVDLTTIHLHGQRVGVVGPNGCGKSNVMESVRWVLGESSAKEMRADAMDAVIFNGAANRKPISRASVELIFDNSLGGASGEWNQYAEIAVKRVIEREKGSTYYINNAAVRRRDVADLFLGTGLGGRAYAIIGQNTISRIVEAKPEELRIFLEEAAGISKYKDRRRETELRLRDTRENLVRVEDICRELQKQIIKLESQAVITQQYHALQESLKLAEGQLWLLKKRDASRDWEKSQTQVERLVNQLEAQVAELRTSESQLETSRQRFYTASEAINVAQAGYYEANAEVANLENQLKQNTEARGRVTLQLQQLTASIERHHQNLMDAKQRLTLLNTDLTQATSAQEQTQSALMTLKESAPEKEKSLKAVILQAQQSEQALRAAKQRVEIERNNIQHLNQSRQENQQRSQRLEHDLTHLVLPDESLLNAHESALAEAQIGVSKVEASLQQLRLDEVNLNAQLIESREHTQQQQRHLTQAEVEIQSLLKMQQSLNSERQVLDWLAHRGLKDNPRLWQRIQIDETWSVALESVLAERLNAVVTGTNDLAERPPGTLAIGVSRSKPINHATNPALQPFIRVVKECPTELAALLNDWLAHIYLLAENQSLNEALAYLENGECLVNQQGDIYSAHGVVYYGQNTNLHGVIERQQRLTLLEKQLPELQTQYAVATERLSDDERQLAQTRHMQQEAMNQQKTAMHLLHQQQLELSKLQQLRATILERNERLQADITNAKQRDTQLLADIVQKENTLSATLSQVSQLQITQLSDAEIRQSVEAQFENNRNAISQAEKLHQESVFNLKLIDNNIKELNSKVYVINEELMAFNLRKTEAEQALILTPMETLKDNLENAITTKQLKETALAESRNQLASEEQHLQHLERAKMQCEQQLNPMRDQLEQSRLKEQEARLYFEQCQSSLLENGLDETMLSKELSEHIKVSALLSKTQQLQQDIIELGPVNLAAIQELTHEAERKSYLDSQMLDLSQASETLAQAIAKIDRETREKLMHTFNVANQHFGELFSTLFGGGQARLELMGEEILDTGLQVFAQPPGKKNTTIQLLSGGEKALTALALVFALFRLNPAPFCLMDEVDAPLDDSNTERFCEMVKKMSEKTQFLFVSHNKITMEIAQQLIGVTMQESGVSRIVDVDIEAAIQMRA